MFSTVVSFSIDLYLHISQDAESNKLIKTVCHHAHFFEILPTSLFGHFHILTFQVLKFKQNTKHVGLYVWCINSMSLHERFTQYVLN